MRTLSKEIRVTGLLEKIQPIIRDEQDGMEKTTSIDPSFVDHITRMNIKQVMKEIPQKSQVIADMLEKGEIAITGGLYDVETGRVHFFEHENILAPLPR